MEKIYFYKEMYVDGNIFKFEVIFLRKKFFDCFFVIFENKYYWWKDVFVVILILYYNSVIFNLNEL